MATWNRPGVIFSQRYLLGYHVSRYDDGSCKLELLGRIFHNFEELSRWRIFGKMKEEFICDNKLTGHAYRAFVNTVGWEYFRTLF